MFKSARKSILSRPFPFHNQQKDFRFSLGATPINKGVSLNLINLRKEKISIVSSWIGYKKKRVISISGP